MALEKQDLVLGVWTGYCPHPVTVDIRGPIKGSIYIYIISIIQLLVRGAVPKVWTPPHVGFSDLRVGLIGFRVLRLGFI